MNRLKQAREKLCADKTPTFHKVLLIYKRLLSTLDDKDDEELWKQVKSFLKTRLNQKLVIHDLNKISTMLVPRFRSLRELVAEDERAQLITYLKNAISPIENLLDDASDTSNDSLMPIVAMDDEFSEFIDEQEAPRSFNQDEVDLYLSQHLDAQDLTMDVIDFWHKKSKEWPKLSQYATFLLSIPATSASSERNLSHAGFTVSKLRTQLKPDKVDELLFIKSNKSLAS